MTRNALAALRNFHHSAGRTTVYVTARDMALQSHNLNRAGTIATTATGDKFYWSEAYDMWVGSVAS